MGDKLKSIGSLAFGAVIFVGLLAIPVIFFLGIAWAAKNLLQPLIVAGWIAIAIDIAILLPLSAFKRFRGFTGGGIFISSFIFGLITWLLSFVLTWLLWGGWAVIAGVLLLGGTVVPFALLATLFKGMWEPFFTVLVLFALTFGSRVAGAVIAESGDR
jgi:hypothetical protein